MADDEKIVEQESEPSLVEDEEMPLDTKLITEAVIELNIARKNVSMYPPGHVQIERSGTRAAKILNEIMSFRPQIVLGVAKDTLLVGNMQLDRKNLVVGDFARSLHQREIASVSFIKGLETDEILKFEQILATDPDDISAVGGITKAVAEAQIPHIKVQELDYSGFHLTEEKEISLSEDEEEDFYANVWEDFVSQLTTGYVDSSDKGRLFRDSIKIDPKELARFLNEGKLDAKNAVISYEQIIADHMRRISERNHLTEEGSSTLTNLFALLSNLKPDLKRQFLSVASRHLLVEQLSPGTKQVFNRFPEDMIIEMVSQANEEGREIPAALMNIVQRIFPAQQESKPKQDGGRIPAKEETDLEEVSQDYIKSLFDQETEVSDTEPGYAAAKKAIAEGIEPGITRSGGAFPIEDYTSSFEDGYLNTQLGMALLAFANRSGSDKEYQEYLDKLMELVPAFLENGNFSFLFTFIMTLRNHSGMSLSGKVSSLPPGPDVMKKAEKGLEKSDRMREIALATLQQFTGPDYTLKVVEAFNQWIETKGQEASDFLLTFGPTCLPGLMDLFAEAQSPDESGVLFKLLNAFGQATVSEAQKRLHDSRDYFVRNLLILIRHTGTAKSIPHIRPLLQHRAPDVWMEALSILLKFTDPTGKMLLQEALLSKNRDISSRAVTLAEQYRGVDVAQDLASLLKLRPLTKSAIMTNEKIIKALGAIGNARILPVLEKLARSNWLLYRNSLWRMKVTLFESLEAYPLDNIQGLLRVGQKSRNESIRKISNMMLREQKTA